MSGLELNQPSHITPEPTRCIANKVLRGETICPLPMEAGQWHIDGAHT